MENKFVISQPEWLSLEALRLRSSEKENDLIDRLYSLLTVESLTQGLEAIDPQFDVKMLSLIETSDYDSPDINKPIHLCRKVALRLSEAAVIYAESHCNPQASEAVSFLNCGTKSLGRRLFSQEKMLQRSDFSYAFFPLHTLPQSLRQMLRGECDSLCARRSYFTIDNQALFITEWYLPELVKRVVGF